MRELITAILSMSALLFYIHCRKSRAKIKQILLFGSSCNPPTKGGHFNMIDFFKDKYDEIWILPVYKHIYASKAVNTMETYFHRLTMSQLTFNKIKNAKVMTTERDVCLSFVNEGSHESPGTIDVVSELYKQNKNTRFTLLLGGDTFADLCQGKWKGKYNLFNMVDFDIVQRQTNDNKIINKLPIIPAEVNSKCKINFFQIPDVSSVSSTIVRQSISQAKNEEEFKAVEDYLDQDVFEYIKVNKLYGYKGYL